MPRELHPFSVLVRPIITEKSTSLIHENKYVFEVDLRANKRQIKEAIEAAFDVAVANVNTIRMKGKRKRFGRNITPRPDWKKAVVTLQPGDSIELFEGI